MDDKLVSAAREKMFHNIDRYVRDRLCAYDYGVEFCDYFSATTLRIKIFANGKTYTRPVCW